MSRRRRASVSTSRDLREGGAWISSGSRSSTGISELGRPIERVLAKLLGTRALELLAITAERIALGQEPRDQKCLGVAHHRQRLGLGAAEAPECRADVL